MGLKKASDKEKDKIAKEEQLKKELETENSEELKVVTEIDEEVKEDDTLETPVEELNIDEVVKEINDQRLLYEIQTKKQRRISTTLSVILFAIMIACFVLALTLGSTYTYVLYICLGVAIVAVVFALVLGKLIKNKLSGKAGNYIDFLFKKQNEYLYQEDIFSKTDSLPRVEMKSEAFYDARIYKDLKMTKSRNFTSTVYKERVLTSADLAAAIMIKNRTSPLFLGKYYDYDFPYEKENLYILFQLKGKELSRPIDDIEGLEKKQDNDRYIIYSNDNEYKKVLTSKVIQDLLKFKIEDPVIDVILSIRKGKLNIGIDYTDDFVNIPVAKEFSKDNLLILKRDLYRVTKIIDDLLK